MSLVLGVLVGTSLSAAPIDPPLELLYSPSNVLIVAKLLRVDSDGHIVLARSRTLSGPQPQPDRITVRADAEVARGLKQGARYVAGYTIYLNNPRDNERRIANPDGPALLHSPGLEPALFEDTQLLRAVLRESNGREGCNEDRRDEKRREEQRREEQRCDKEQDSRPASRELFGLLLKALQGSDRQLQNLAANELAYNRDVVAIVDPKTQAMLRDFVINWAKLPAARSALLQAGFHDPGKYGGWWPSAAQSIVANTPVDGYSGRSAGLDGLAMAAFSVLAAGKTQVDANALTRWVAGESPALSERALVMLRKQSPASERSAVKAALAKPDLPAQTRTFLEVHLHRLDLLQEKRQQPKQPSGRS